MTGADVRVFSDESAMQTAAASAIGAAIRGGIAKAGRFAIVLAGGETPREVYARLATDAAVDWGEVHFFWGDERFLPADDRGTNRRMAEDALLRPARALSANVHSVDLSAGSAEEAADRYDRRLRDFFGGAPRFDLVLAGVGEDGHTASLFPGNAALEESARWAVAVSAAPKPPPERVTLTVPALCAARQVFFIASGAGKSAVLRRILMERDEAIPAARIRPTGGQAVWWLDRAAAQNLDL